MEVVTGGLYLYEPPQVPRSGEDARFVASGQEQLGLRPYIVISRDLVHRGKTTAVAVPFTTKIHKANAYRIALPAAEFIRDLDSNFEFADSVALCDNVRVLDVTRIRYKIGRLSDNGIFAIQLGLTYVFGIR
jgi:mRNA interferase MazF